MKRIRQIIVILLISLVYALIKFVIWLYYLGTAEKFIFDDGITQTEIFRCDIRTLPSEIDAAFDLCNKTGTLYTYTVLGHHKTSQAQYVNGVRDGMVTNWYHSGMLQTVDSYIAGRLHGYCEWYYPNGIKRTHSLYSNGVELASCSWYDSGSIKSQYTYYATNGCMKSSMEWNRNGVLVECVLNDLNQNPTSGYIHVNNKLYTQQIAYDVVGKTNFVISQSDNMNNSRCMQLERIISK